MTDDQTLDAMKQCGGSFIQQLRALWFAADPTNRARIKTAFADYWRKYERLATLHAERERAQAAVNEEEETHD